MRRILVLASLVVLVMVGGCAGKWEATGGSRADGNVVMSYEGDMFTAKPDNDAEALEMALKRCKSWGYADVEVFEGSTRTHVNGGIYRHSKTYQCIGQGVETEIKK